MAGKRQIADMVLPKSSSVGDLDADQLRVALGINPDLLLAEEIEPTDDGGTGPAGADDDTSRNGNGEAVAESADPSGDDLVGASGPATTGQG